VGKKIQIKIQSITHHLAGSNKIQIGGHHLNQRKPKGLMKRSKC